MTVQSRFVILHHTGIAVPHMDLLFEAEEAANDLMSFRCPQWPPVLGDTWIETPPHRTAYLDFEGPVSGGRGTVRRVDAGTITVVPLQAEPVTLGFRMRGQDFAGEITIQLTDLSPEERWTVLTLISNCYDRM